MDIRTAYTRRLEKALRRQQRFGVFAIVSVTAGAGMLLAPDLMASRQDSTVAHGSAASTPAAAPAAVQEAATSARRVYPYSIIPGGVADVAELKRVMRADPVVAAHYAGFDVERARAVTVAKPRAVYVSYRKGDQVFWTAKKLMLVQGETLLSDGENEMRARCANRISDVPRFPVEPHGPGEKELDIVLEGAMGDAEGMFLATAGGIDLDQGGGARYPLAYFPDGGGLVQPAGSPPAAHSAPPSVPNPGLPPVYGSGRPVYGMAQSSASHSDPGARPGTGASGGGVPDGGVKAEAPSSPEGGAPVDTPVNTPVDTPVGEVPSTPPGGGTPVTPVTPGTVPGKDAPGPVGQPPTPMPEAGPEVPPYVPTSPGVPPVTPGDADLPAPPVEVPEPGTLWLSSAAMVSMLWLRRRTRQTPH